MDVAGALKLDLGQAQQDSPSYRANLQFCDDQVEEFGKWLEGISKFLKLRLEDMRRDERSLPEFSSKLSASIQLKLLDESKTIPTLKTFAEMLVNLGNFKSTLLTQTSACLLDPVENYLKDDLRTLRDSRKAYEKMAEKYENALNKFGNSQRSKEANALKEVSLG